MDSNKSQLEILAALDAAERLGVGGGLSRTELNTICVALRERLTPAPLSPDVQAAVKRCEDHVKCLITGVYVDSVAEDFRTLLRAVRDPRLTGGLACYLRQMDAYFERMGTDGFRNGLRLYWPDAFAGELGEVNHG